MIAYVFPGQGSQRRGMGGDLFDKVREYASVEGDVDALMGYSIRKQCLEDPGQRLKETAYTQPSMYVVNALHYYDALAREGPPAVVAGHSLGEYNALLAAGAVDFLTGLRLVKRRGEIMAEARGGLMAAVVGIDAARVVAILREERLSAIDVANYNAPAQTVLSGPADEIKRAGPFFDRAGARAYVQLPVSAAFHSRYMADAAARFDQFLASFSFAPLRLPVIANVTGEPYPSAVSAAALRAILVEQFTRPVSWAQSVRTMRRMGVTTFREVGQGSVLTRLIDQIDAAKGS